MGTPVQNQESQGAGIDAEVPPTVLRGMAADRRRDFGQRTFGESDRTGNGGGLRRRLQSVLAGRHTGGEESPGRLLDAGPNW